jgi:hypothetical protein
MYSGEKWAFLFVYTRPKVIVFQELWHFGVIAWLFQTIRVFCYTDLYSVPQFEKIMVRMTEGIITFTFF